MERKEGWVKAGCVKILWTVMVVFLGVVPSVQADVTVLAGEELDIAYDVGGILDVYGIANVDTGFYAAWGIYAFPGSTVNIRGGAIGANYGVILAGWPAPTVTVYGTDFAVTTGTIEDDKWTPGGGSGILTGTYQNGDPISLLFYSSVAINLVNTAVGGPDEITIDIKPGSYPNTINLGSNGVVPVAILSTPDFLATELDPDTVSLAGSGVAVRGKGNKSLATQEDVNGDGLMDLVVKVETENLDPGTFQDGLATLQVIVDNTVIYEGSDSITIVPPE
jgi:hypothetical protein